MANDLAIRIRRRQIANLHIFLSMFVTVVTKGGGSKDSYSLSQLLRFFKKEESEPSARPRIA